METKDIIELKGAMENYHSKRDANFRKLTDYYEQLVNFENMPADIEIYRSPAARKQVDAALSHWMALNEKISVPVYRESEKTKNLVSRLTQYGEAYLKYVNKYQSNLRRICGKHGFLYGTYGLKAPLYAPRRKPVRMDEEDIKDYNKRVMSWEKSLEETFPITHRAVHPINLLWDSLDTPSFVIEKYTRKAISIRKEWGDKFDNGKYKDFDDVQWWEYWDDESFAFFTGDQKIEEGENIYGYIPYLLGDAGFGLEDEDALPERRIAGLIAPALSAYYNQMRLMTAIESGLEYGVWRQRVIEEPPGPDLQESNLPGEYSVIPKHYNYHLQDAPSVIKDAYAFLQAVGNDQEMITPRVVQGLGSDATSGYMEAIRVGEAKLGYGGMVESWEKSMSILLDRSLYLIKNVIMEPVGLTGNFNGKGVLTISPSEINVDNQHFYVTLDATTPEQIDRRIMLGLRMQMAGAASYETICREFYGLDPEKEDTRILIETALKSPMIQQAVAMEALSDAGMQQIIDLIKSGATTQQPENFRNSDYTRSKMRGGPQMSEIPQSNLEQRDEYE